MTKPNYEESLRRLLAHEGGYTNHPADPGGPTNFGITLADYRRFAKADATAADIRAMRVDEAKAIYRAHYWDALRCDELPGGLDYAVFDYGVNSGIGRAATVLRRLAGLADGGRVDDALIAALRQRAGADLINRLCDERLTFFKRLKTWPVFGTGWSRRVAEVRAAALQMASQASGPPPSVATGKAITPTASGKSKAAAGGIAAAGATAAQQAHQLGASLALVIAIVVAAAVLAVAVLLIWRQRQHTPITTGDTP